MFSDLRYLILIFSTNSIHGGFANPLNFLHRYFFVQKNRHFRVHNGFKFIGMWFIDQIFFRRQIFRQSLVLARKINVVMVSILRFLITYQAQSVKFAHVRKNRDLHLCAAFSHFGVEERCEPILWVWPFVLIECKRGLIGCNPMI